MTMIRIIFIHLPFLSEKIWGTKFFPIHKASNYSNHMYSLWNYPCNLK